MISTAVCLALNERSVFRSRLEFLVSFWYGTETMKTDIHPKYYSDAKVACACGNNFTVGSTEPEIHVEICNNCHPFFTGQEKFVDTEGRVERFQRLQDAKKEVKPKKDLEQKKDDRPKSLKEMLMAIENK